MFDVEIYNFYKHEWEIHRANRIESKPSTSYGPKNSNEVHIFNGILNRNDSAIVITTDKPFYVGLKLLRPEGY